MYRRVLFNFHVYNYQSAVKVSQWLISTLLCINTYIRIYIYIIDDIYIYIIDDILDVSQGVMILVT